jgi:hypothetical protein
MHAGEVRVAERPLRFGRVEAEDPVQAFIVGRNARVEVDVPRTHARGAERISESVPGK